MRNKYLLELCESKTRNKIEQACKVWNAVLIHKDKTLQISFKLGIIDSFMPSRDHIKRIAKFCYATIGKTNWKTNQQTLPAECNLRKND